MTSDLEFAAHLRDRLEVIAPDVAVDTSVVVRGGRRRQRVTALGSVAATTLVLAGGGWVAASVVQVPTPVPGESPDEWTAPAWFAEQAAQRAAFRDSLQACVDARGWAITVDEWGGGDHPSPRRRRWTGSSRTSTTAREASDVTSRNVDSETNTRNLYPMLVDTWECVVHLGYDVPPPPSEDELVRQYETDGPSEPIWTPYGDLMEAQLRAGHGGARSDLPPAVVSRHPRRNPSVAILVHRNRTFRLGDELLVRLPSAAGYAEAVAKEQRWLPVLAQHLPLPIPAPVAVGVPGQGYPWPWSVYRWLPGDSADAAPPEDLTRFAVDLAAFLTALQRAPGPGPEPGAHNWWRGGPVGHYDHETRHALEVLAGEVDVAGRHRGVGGRADVGLGRAGRLVARRRRHREPPGERRRPERRHRLRYLRLGRPLLRPGDRLDRLRRPVARRLPSERSTRTRRCGRERGGGRCGRR